MNQLQLFDNPEFGKIRVVIIDDEPYFVGKDVATALGYKDTFAALKQHVDDEDKQNWQDTSFESPRGMTVINESGVYSLILRSKLPRAREFKRWVTYEVLPSIRKHGVYVKEQAAVISPDFLRRIADEMEARDRKIAELQPKATYCDKILHSDEALAISIIAQDYGLSAMAMNKLLADMKIQHRVGKTWVINYPYANMGYTISRTFDCGGIEPVTHTYWTQKGRFFLYNVLRKRGVLPIIEREDAYAHLLPKEYLTC